MLTIRPTCLLLLLLVPLAALAGPAADQRITLLGQQIGQSPQQQDLYLKRALVYSDNGQPGKALADIEQARAIGPGRDTGLVHGIVLYREGQLPAARERFDAYLAHYPSHSAALQYRARLLRDSGAGTEALADYLQLLRNHPEQDPGHYLAAAQLMTDTGQALTLLDTRMADTGPIPQLQRKAIALERQRGYHEAAIARLQTLAPATRATAAWHLEMVELLQLSDREQEARPHLVIARELLAQSRPTRARIELQEKLAALEATPGPSD